VSYALKDRLALKFVLSAFVTIPKVSQINLGDIEILCPCGSIIA
jgi:hypothetical protein